MNAGVRKPYVAGKFYPATAREITGLFETIKRREKTAINYNLSGKQITGAVLPHAGYVFSGYEAIHFFEIMAAGTQEVETIVIVHPIHRGGALDYAADGHAYWQTPLGETPVDQEFISAMQIGTSADFLNQEHSAEVMVPFIQEYLDPAVQIVPVGIGWQHPDVSRKIARAILRAEENTGRRICVIASSDFSHYLDPETGRKKDQLVLDHIIKMETGKVYSSIRDNNISVCGYGPIMCLMYYTGYKSDKVSVEVMARGNSGDVYPSDSVVDYISILFYTEP